MSEAVGDDVLGALTRATDVAQLFDDIGCNAGIGVVLHKLSARWAVRKSEKTDRVDIETG